MSEELNIINADQSWDNQSNESVIFNNLINDTMNGYNTGVALKNGSPMTGLAYDKSALNSDPSSLHQYVNGEILGEPSKLNSDLNKNDDNTNYQGNQIALTDSRNDTLYLNRKYKRYSGTAAEAMLDDSTNEGRVVFKADRTGYSWENDGSVNAMTSSYELNQNLWRLHFGGHNAVQIITPAIYDIIFADSATFKNNGKDITVSPSGDAATASSQNGTKGFIPSIPITIFDDQNEASVELDASSYFNFNDNFDNAPAILKIIVHDISFGGMGIGTFKMNYKISWRFFITAENQANQYSQSMTAYEISPISSYTATDSFVALNKFDYWNDQDQISYNKF